MIVVTPVSCNDDSSCQIVTKIRITYTRSPLQHKTHHEDIDRNVCSIKQDLIFVVTEKVVCTNTHAFKVQCIVASSRSTFWHRCVIFPNFTFYVEHSSTFYLGQHFLFFTPGMKTRLPFYPASHHWLTTLWRKTACRLFTSTSTQRSENVKQFIRPNIPFQPSTVLTFFFSFKSTNINTMKFTLAASLIASAAAFAPASKTSSQTALSAVSYNLNCAFRASWNSWIDSLRRRILWKPFFESWQC